MSTEIKNIISELLESSSHFNSSDILVDIVRNEPHIWFDPRLKVPVSEFPAKLVRNAQASIRETGINPMCRMQGTIKLERNNTILTAPLFLTSLKFKIDKVRHEITFEEDESGVFLNPFVINQLKALDVTLIDVESEGEIQEKWVKYLIQSGFEIDSEKTGIGNFHHHRYELVKELEDLIHSDSIAPSIKQLLLGEKTERKITLPQQLLFPADIDHKAVFSSFETENTVVQGPPGTGKSQLLTNIIVKAIDQNYFTLVVSEKYSALEVIVKKLGEFGLDKLCTIASSDRSSKAFLAQLEKTWKYFESFEIKNSGPVYLAENFSDNLQMTLDLLNQENLIGGVSFHVFHSTAPDLSGKIDYYNTVPSIPEFRKNQSTIESIYTNKICKSLGALKHSFFISEDFETISTQLEEITNHIDDLKSFFNLEVWSDIESAMRTASNIQVFENEVFKKFGDVFLPDSTKQKKFLRLYKSYLKLNKSDSGEVDSHWKKPPSTLELENLKMLRSTKGFLAQRKFKRRWQQLSNLSIEFSDKAIDQELQFQETRTKLSQIEVKFCDLGIETPKTEAKIIAQFIPLFSLEKWELFDSINPSERSNITTSHHKIEELYSTLKSIFKLSNSDNIQEKISDLKNDLPLIVEQLNEIKNLSRAEFELLSFADNFDTYSKLVYGHHWIQFKQRFPQFSNFTPEDLSKKIEKIIGQEKEDAQVFASEILNKVAKNFKHATDLLSTPAAKLSDFEKKRKKALRKGKSILVKEFSKTRQHPSLRELFNSEARFWISILQPIWLSNPAELSHCFPMKEELFDIVIFDEASQIPLQNSLGAIQRSKSVLVAGDDQQMGPTSYFQSGNSTVISLLHQASFYFNQKYLTHHYRSEHPSLIEFSNRYFYQNRLAAFPSAEKSFESLTHHYVKDGEYENRQNKIEASHVARKIESLLHHSEHIGIVAFSQEQLDCIWDELITESRDLLLSKIDENKAFFKPLEKVQGDECDRLIISFGFGRNKDGEFHHRFGPMNQEQGRNRLNVLLTRARKQIHFFSSVKSSDFKLSTNESVELIRKWILFSEKSDQNADSGFPYGLTPIMNGNQITFSQIQKHLEEATELVNLHRILSSRGWECIYN